MARIIICIDGTGNEIGDRESNILKLYKALDKDDPDQKAHYVMGVGTYDGPQFLGRTRQVFNGVLGLAFGLGLEDDVLSAYRFLCENYQSREMKQAANPGLSDDAVESDQIYLCGFSRGAYAARMLAGFIHNFGLVAPDRLHLIAPAFRAYRDVSDFDETEEPEKVFQSLREYERVLDPSSAPVRALLLFDTVSSMIRFRRPLANLRKHASFAEFGTHPSVNSNVSVRIVLHALAIHERRSLFRAQNWTPECDDDGAPLYFGNNFRNAKSRRTQIVRQRWFPGFHSDIGGAAPEDASGIGKISLLWMLDALITAEKHADAEDNAARKKARRSPLPGQDGASKRSHGFRLKRGNRKWYLEGDTDKRTPSGRRYAKPDPNAPIHDSHRNGKLGWVWSILEFFPKSLSRRAPGTPAWYRRGLLWYLPLFEPRPIPDDHEIDPSASAHPR